jgi:hypothetical protein
MQGTVGLGPLVATYDNLTVFHVVIFYLAEDQ